MSGDDLAGLVARVPPGWTRVAYRGRAWGLSRTDHADGRSVFVEADELGGQGRLSTNVWFTTDEVLLRPCEVPTEDVLAFLRGWTATLDTSAPRPRGAVEGPGAPTSTSQMTAATPPDGGSVHGA